MFNYLLFNPILVAGAYKSIVMTRSAPSKLEYTCDAPQNVIDRVAKWAIF